MDVIPKLDEGVRSQNGPELGEGPSSPSGLFCCNPKSFFRGSSGKAPRKILSLQSRGRAWLCAGPHQEFLLCCGNSSDSAGPKSLFFGSVGTFPPPPLIPWHKHTRIQQLLTHPPRAGSRSRSTTSPLQATASSGTNTGTTHIPHPPRGNLPDFLPLEQFPSVSPPGCSRVVRFFCQNPSDSLAIPAGLFPC